MLFVYAGMVSAGLYAFWLFLNLSLLYSNKILHWSFFLFRKNDKHLIKKWNPNSLFKVDSEIRQITVAQPSLLLLLWGTVFLNYREIRSMYSWMRSCAFICVHHLEKYKLSGSWTHLNLNQYASERTWTHLFWTCLGLVLNALDAPKWKNMLFSLHERTWMDMNISTRSELHTPEVR